MSDKLSLSVEVLDLDKAVGQLRNFKQEFNELRTSFEDAPSMTGALNEGLERASSIVDMLQEKISKARLNNRTDDQDFVQDVQSGLKELGAMSSLFGQDGAFGASFAKSIVDGFSQTIRQQLSAETGELSSMLKAQASRLAGLTAKTAAGEFVKSKPFEEFFMSKGHGGITRSDVYQKYVEALIPNILPAFNTAEYQRARYGHILRNNNTTAQPVDLLPASFRESYRNKGYTSMAMPSGTRILSAYNRTQLRDLIRDNDEAARAAYGVKGMTKLEDNGELSLVREITPQMLDDFRRNLFTSFVKRASGRDSQRVDIFKGLEDMTSKEVRQLVSRMTSSSAGRLLSIMSDIDGIGSDKDWSDAGSLGRGFEKLGRSTKHMLEQYEIAKYTVGDLFNNTGKSSRVMLSESQNTRMLGLEGHHNDFTDKVIFVSADGYDRNDPKQQAFVEELLSGKAVPVGQSGKKYIAQNMHGTGTHAGVRMVEQQAYEAVMKREQEWAQKHGFVTADGKGANFWNDFVDSTYEFKDIEGLRKHFDATGKGWSNSWDTHGNFKNRNFAVVDLSQINDDNVRQKLADGIGWFMDGILPEKDFQGRMGVAGKGTFHQISGYKTVGEWAKAAGLTDANGRFILPSVGGNIDLTDYHGFVDASTIKNMQAYSNFHTPEEISKGFTAMLQHYGMSSMSTYDDAETRAKGIGTQAMAFMNLSPKMRQQQIDEFDRRINLLNSEAGIREYLFADPDNYLGKQIRSGKLTVNSSAVQSWVQNEIESLTERMSSGEWIDFGANPSVINQTINKSPLASILGLETINGLSRPDLLKRIRQQYQEKTGTALTISDEDLEGVFALNKGQLVDFARPDAQKVAVQRSPSLFGNFVVGRNYANLARDIYKVFGQTPSGLFASEADLATLGSADLDGDKAKTIYGDLAEAFAEVVAIQEKAIQDFEGSADPIIKKVDMPAEAAKNVDSPLHRRLFFQTSQDVTNEMGAADAAARRAAMFDIYAPENRDLLAAAVQSTPTYDQATAGLKHATSTEATPQMKKALYAGAQWSKLPSRFSRLFNVTGRDNMDVPSPEDIYTATVNGREIPINMKELRDLGFDKINFRSIFNTTDVGTMRAVSQVASKGVNMDRTYALLQALEHMGYGGAGETTQALMKNLRTMKAYDIANPMAPMSAEELDDMQAMIIAAKREIEEEAYQKAQGGMIKMEDGSEVSFDSYVQKKMNEYGVTAAQGFIERGINQPNIRSVFRTDDPSKLLPELFLGQKGGLDFSFAGKDAVLQREAVEKKLQENQAELQRIEIETKQHEEQMNQIKSTLPQEDQARYSSDITKEEAVEASKRIFAAGGDLAKAEAEAAQVARVYDEVDQLAAGNGVDMQAYRNAVEQRQHILDENAQLSKAYTYIQAQEHANALRSSVDDVKQQFLSGLLRKENELEGKSQAETYYGSRAANVGFVYRQLEDFIKNGEEFNQLPPAMKQEFKELVGGRKDLMQQMNQDFADTTELKAKRLYENLGKTNRKRANKVSALDVQFEEYDNQLQAVEDYRNELQKHLQDREKYPFSPAERKLYEERLAETDTYLAGAREETGKMKEADITNLLDKIKGTVIKDPFQQLKQGANEAKEVVSQLSERLEKVYKDQGMSDEEVAKKMEPYSMLTQQIDENTKFQQQHLKLQDRARVAQVLSTYMADVDKYDIDKEKSFLDFREEQDRINKKKKKTGFITEEEAKIVNTTFEDYKRKYDEQNLDVSRYLEGVEAVRDKAQKNVDNARKIADRIRKSDLTQEQKDERLKPLERFNDDYVKREEAAYNERIRQRQKQTELRGEQEIMQAQRAEIQVQQMNRNWQSRTAIDPLSRTYLQRQNMYDQYRSQYSYNDMMVKRMEEQQLAAKNAFDNAATDEDKNLAQAQYDSATASLDHYRAALESTKEAMKEFGDTAGNFKTIGNMLAAGFETAATAADKLLQSFGRKMIRQAFTEAKNFVVQFDSQMRGIQAITMKTDEQMQAVKKATVDRAIELKTSVTNVASVESDLYRQGLNDQQVEERTGAIIKFATVTGAKVTDAGKAITTAIQNGLVNSAEEAMDALTALGDSAATTANEIFKGMQKSAAAAKVAGVSYNELTSMLTIGISKTQMSGQVIGTAMQTIFSRMNRVTNQGYVNDETGASVSINDVEKALSGAGIKLREGGGKSFRNSFDVLRDLSKVWGSLNDIQRNNITYTMAGGRQTNVFQTLMEGMGEDGGAELDRLLGLAENSEGTTDSKYAVAVRSITAAMEELKSTYDGLVSSMSSNQFFVSSVDMVTGFVGGLKDLTSVAGPVSTAAVVIGGALAALATKLLIVNAASNTFKGAAGLVSTLASVVAIAGVLGVAGAIGSARKDFVDRNDPTLKAKQEKEIANKYLEKQQKRISPLKKQIDEVNKYGEAWEKADGKMSEANTVKFESSLNNLKATLSRLNIEYDKNAQGIENWRKVAEAGESGAEALSKEAIDRSNRRIFNANKQVYDPTKLIEAEEKYNQYYAESPVEQEAQKPVYLLNYKNYLGTSESLYTALAERVNELHRIGRITEDDYDYDRFKSKDYLSEYNKIMLKIAGVDVNDPNLGEKYDDYILNTDNSAFVKALPEEALKTDIFGMMGYLDIDQQIAFIESFKKYLRSDNVKNLGLNSKDDYQILREKTIDDVLKDYDTSLLTRDDEDMQNLLRQRLIEDIGNVSAADLRDAAFNKLVEYSNMGGAQFVKDTKKRYNKYNYYYTDENGKQLFGFDDLDKAEEAYNARQQKIPDNKQSLPPLGWQQQRALSPFGWQQQHAKPLTQQLNIPEQSKGPALEGFDESRIVDENGRQVYQNLSDFVSSKTLLTKDYTDVYQKMLTYAVQAGTYENLKNNITNVERQLPNLSGVMANDAEFAKMIKDLNDGTGKYTMDQFIEYLQTKALQSSISDFTANLISSNMSYGQEQYAFNAIKNGTAGSEQYDLIAKQWGVDRTNFEANRQLYEKLEESRLNRIREDSAHAYNNYMQNTFGEYLKTISDEDLKTLEQQATDGLFNEIVNRYASTIQNDKDRKNFLNLIKLGKDTGYTTTLTSDRRFSTSYSGGNYQQEDVLNPATRQAVSVAQTRRDVLAYINGTFDDKTVNEDRKKALASYSSEMKEYINMSDDLRKSLEGVKLLNKIKIQLAVEGIDDVTDAGQAIENLQQIVQMSLQGGLNGQKAQTLKNQEVSKAAYSAYMMQQTEAVLNGGTMSDELRQYMIQDLGYKNLSNEDISKINLAGEFMSQDRINTRTAQMVQELTAYKLAMEKAGQTADLDYIQRMGGQISAYGTVAMANDWWKNMSYTPDNLLKEYGNRYSSEIVDETFRGILDASERGETYTITDQTLFNQIRQRFGDVATVLMNPTGYREDYIKEQQENGRAQLAMATYKEAERNQNIATGYSDIANNLLFGKGTQRNEAISRLNSEYKQISQLAGMLNESVQTPEMKQTLADLAGVSVENYTEADAARVKQIIETKLNQYIVFLDMLNGSGVSLDGLYEKASGLTMENAKYDYGEAFTLENYYSNRDVATAANTILGYLGNRNFEGLREYAENNHGVTTAAVGKYSDLNKLYNMAMNNSEDFDTQLPNLASNILRDMYSNEFVKGMVLDQSSEWIQGLFSLNPETVQKTQQAMTTMMDEHNKNIELANMSYDQLLKNSTARQRYVDLLDSVSSEEDLMMSQESFNKAQKELQELNERRNAQITVTGNMLMSTGNSFIFDWLGLNTGKSKKKNKWKSPSKIFTDEDRRRMVEDLINGATGDQLSDNYGELFTKTTDVWEFANLEAQGASRSSPEMQKRLKQLRKAYTDNPFEGYEAGLTSRGRLEEINKLIASGSNIAKEYAKLSPEIKSQLQSFPGLFDYMATYGQSSEQAAKAAKTFADAIRNELIGALEEEGEVLSGLSTQLNNIINGNVIDSTSQRNNLTAQIEQMDEVRQAYERIQKGGFIDEKDWQLMQQYWHISDSNLDKYRLNPNSFTSDYQAEIAELGNLRERTLQTSVSELLKGAAGNDAYTEVEKEPASILRRFTNWIGWTKPETSRVAKSDEEIVKAIGVERAREIVGGLATIGDDGTITYNGKADAKLTRGQELQRRLDLRAAAPSTKDEMNELVQAAEMLRMVNGNVSMWQTMLSDGDLFKTTAVDKMFENADFIDALSSGNTNKAIAMMKEAGGITHTNAYKMSDNKVQNVISSILSEDINAVNAAFENDEDLKNYAMSIDGFESLYNTLRDQGAAGVEKYQTDALKAGSAYKAVYEQERNGKLKAGSAELAQRLTNIDRAKGPTREERRLISTEGSEIQRTSQAAQIAQTMYNNQANLTETDWEYLQTKAKLTDEEIKEYKKTPEKLKDLAKDLKGDQQKIRDSLEAAIVGAFPEISSLSDLSEEGNKKIRELVEQLLDMSGLQLTEKDGKITGISEIPDNRTAYEILTQGAAANIEPEKEAEAYKNRLARLAMQSSDQESLMNAINSDAELLDYLKKDEGARMLGGGFDEIFYNSEHGWTYDQMRNALIQGTGYAPLYRDQLFNNNMEIARQQFGEGFGTSSSLNLNTEQLANVQSYIANHEDFAQWLSDIEGGADLLYAIGNATEDFTYDMTALNGEFSARKIEQYSKFNKASKDIASGVRALSGDIKDSNAYMKSFRQGVNAIANNQYYREKYNKGDRSNDVLSAIAQGTGLDKKDLRKGGSVVQQAIKNWETEDKQAIDNYLNTAGTMLTEGLQGTFNEKLQNLGLDGSQIQLLIDKGQVTVDLSQLANEATGAAQAQIQEIMATLSQMGMQATGVVTSDGSNIKLQFQTTDLGKGRSGGGGGGGGGGKSAAQKLLERLKREQAQLNHEIKMIQYQETKYENAGEIGNQNRMIELENEAQKRLIATLEKHIETTKKQMAKTKKNSDDWKSLYDSVLAYEEAIEEANIAIQENTKKIEENEQAILKLHTDLETKVDTEINNRIQRERDMLAGTVSMQDAIIEAIRARYRAEWALIEKDIEKKRAALEEEKNLIDERLQRRKDAEDEAEKYEELAEYKKQLALIEMDSTRTKDAAKLREQIAKIEKEIAWDAAEDEADYQKEQIDSQLQAYDDFVNYGGEDLEAWLEDANNLADEVNQVMQMSQEGMLDWLKANVEEYGLAMDAAQKQMIQGWIDTYEKMIGYTHTYWDEIADILSGKDLFLNYMMASQDYINASEDEQKQMLYDWGEMYDNWIAAQKRDAIYSHSDNGLSGIGTNGSSKKSGSGSGSNPKQDDTPQMTSWLSDMINGALNSIKNMGTKTDTQTVKASGGGSGAGVALEKRYASGGLVDYTGPAWVDGTPMKPEAFLNADDTALIRSFLDEAKVVRYRSTISNIDSNSFSGNSQNIGELVINITEAQFKDDADFDEVAQRVGQKFVKELSKQGFNTMSYSF